MNTRRVACCTLKKGLFLLTMKLRGENAERLCLEMADKIGRFLAGDLKLIEEIRENASSMFGVHPVMRAAMNSQQLASQENVQIESAETTPSEQRVARKRDLQEIQLLHEQEMQKLALLDAHKENEVTRQVRLLQEQDRLKEVDAKRQKCLWEDENRLKEVDTKRQKYLWEEEDRFKENEAKRQETTKAKDYERFIFYSNAAREMQTRELQYMNDKYNAQLRLNSVYIAGGMIQNGL